MSYAEMIKNASPEELKAINAELGKILVKRIIVGAVITTAVVVGAVLVKNALENRNAED